MKKHPCVRSSRFFLGLMLVALLMTLSASSIHQTAFAADPGVWTVKAPMPTAQIYPVVESIFANAYLLFFTSGVDA